MNAGSCSSSTSASGAWSKTIAAPGVHGVIAVPQIHRVYASATDARQLFTIDSRTGRVLNRAPAGEYPDGLVYDPAERHVFVSDESGGIEAVFDAAGRRIATVQLGGDAGNVQYDPGSGKRSRRRPVAQPGGGDRSALEPCRSPGRAAGLRPPARAAMSTRRAGSRSSPATATRGCSRSTSRR